MFIGQDVGTSVVAGPRRNTVIGQGALAKDLTDAADHNTGLEASIISIDFSASNTAIGHQYNERQLGQTMSQLVYLQ